MPPFLVSKLTLWQVWEVWIESAFLEINILHRLEIFRQNQTTQLCNNMIFARPVSGLAVSKSEIVTLSQQGSHITIAHISQISCLPKKMTSFTAVCFFCRLLYPYRLSSSVWTPLDVKRITHILALLQMWWNMFCGFSEGQSASHN